MSAWLEPGVWHAVADELARHRQAGLGRLLTEDVVRFAAARALAAHGCDADKMRLEWAHPTRPGSRIDLVVGSGPDALIEFKYPREPAVQNAAWTMALGEVLKDLYRLAAVPQGDRIFVYVETARLQRYMASAATRCGMSLDVDDVVLDPVVAHALPATAAAIIGPDLLAQRVTATRLYVIPMGDQLRLSVYRVESSDADAGATGREQPALAVPALASAPLAADPATAVGVTRSGVREEIHSAVQAVLVRSRASTFTVDEVIREMRRRGTTYAESTIHTMITSHLCANAPDHAAVTYDDFERVGRGLYRLI